MKLLKIVTVFVVLSSMCHAARQPNVVFILADDLGWSDTTLYGTTSLYKTPNLERLAKSGMTFTRAYAASPLCSPTRSSILTGLNPARIGITAPTCHKPEVILKASVSPTGPVHAKALVCQSVSRFDTKYYTLAERLKDEGYVTGHFGKWHLGPEPYSPLEHGFNVDIPHWPGPGPAGSFVAPWKFKTFKEAYPKEHIEDRMGDEAVRWMEAHKGEPFFLNYWQFSVHAPFDAKQAYIDAYRKEIDPENPQRSPTYAAMVQSLDENVGKVLDALERLKLVENTILIFFSDNGGNMYNVVDGTTPTSNLPLRGGKASMYEGGVRVPAVVRWPGVVKAGSQSDVIIQSPDFYPTLLDMLELKSDLAFDGISIVPALKGGTLDRDAIFTYFPHSPKVPDHLPPAVSVHQGEWKLIRIYFGGEGTQHACQLYHLGDDMGETKNLAAQNPERVQAMDALIENFLKQTEAVQPEPNPAYRPGADLSKAGHLAFKGWRADNHCHLEVQKGELLIHSTGRDPHLSVSFKASLPPSGYALELTMASQAPGPAQLFWKDAGRRGFAKERSTGFSVQPGADLQRYEVAIAPTKPLLGLRLDPARGEGLIRVKAMVLRDADGQLVKTWTF